MTCPTIGRSCSRFHLIFCSPVVTHTLRRHWFAGDSGTGLQSMRHKMLSPAISLLDSALDLLVPISILDHFTTDLLKFQPHRFHSIFKPQFLFLVQLIEVAVAFTLRIAENHVGQESCYFKEKTLCINSSPKSNVITLRLV